MKLQNIQEVEEFRKVVHQCKGRVYLESLEGDIFNLKSAMSEYVALGRLLSDPKSKTAQQGPVSPLWPVDWGKAALCKTTGAAGHRGGSAKTARRFSGVSEAHGGVRLSGKAWPWRCDLLPCSRAGVSALRSTISWSKCPIMHSVM